MQKLFIAIKFFHLDKGACSTNLLCEKWSVEAGKIMIAPVFSRTRKEMKKNTLKSKETTFYVQNKICSYFLVSIIS